MAEEALGQAQEQPALSVPTEMNEAQAREHFSRMLEKEEKPRDPTGKFAAKPKPEGEAPVEEEAPAEEVTEEEAPEETPAEKRRFKLKYKGEELEKDEDEVVTLAQQGFDYTQKSQALAKERAEMEAKIKAEVDSQKKIYEQQLAANRAAVLKFADPEALMSPEEVLKVSREDPMRAQQILLKQMQLSSTLQAIDAEQQKLTQQRQSELQETMRKQARESLEKLETKIPGWDNGLYGKILKSAVKEYGFDQKEVNAITDHRAIEVLHDAMKYRELKAAKPNTVDKKVAAVPKVQKPGTAEKPDQKAQALADKRAALSKSGRKEDAAAVFAELMRQGKLT